MSFTWRQRSLTVVVVVLGALALPCAVAASPTRTNTRISADTGHGRREAERIAVVLPLAIDSPALARFATAVSTPGSRHYRHYEPVAALARRFGASARERTRVLTFLGKRGVLGARIDRSGLFVQAELTRSLALRLFSRPRAARKAARGRRAGHAGVMIPLALRGIITGVIGLHTGAQTQAAAAITTTPVPTTTTPTLSQPTPGAASAYAGPDGTPHGCAAGIAPAGFAPNQYLGAYGYAPLHHAGPRGQGEHVALIEIDGFRMSDLAAFDACFGLPLPKLRSRPIGSPRLLAPGGEATLDLEVLSAAAPHLASIDVYETRPDAADVLRALTAPLDSSGPAPNVISVSLGLCEKSTLAAVGRAGIATTEAALEEAAAAGISVLAAAGDSGSAGCLGSGAQARAPLPQLAVIYPASSPWVTSVGGVNLELSSQNQIEGQVVWNDASVRPGLAGGGGFSTLFTRPGYQRGVVGTDQRAVPDVALLADISPGYDAYCTAQANCNGRGWMTFGGTSAATPLEAGGFALIDQLLREKHLQALGLANPLLYRLAQQPPGTTPLLTDVTAGSNDVGPFIQGDRQLLGCCTASTGFDEASGWGAVNLAVLAQDAQSAQAPVGQVSLRTVDDQAPVAAGRIAVLLRCTRSCDVTLRAKLQIPGQPAFTVRTHLVVLGARLARRVLVRFTAAQLLRLKAALKRHLHVTAALTAALTDAAGNFERQTRTLRVTIRG